MIDILLIPISAQIPPPQRGFLDHLIWCACPTAQSHLSQQSILLPLHHFDFLCSSNLYKIYLLWLLVCFLFSHSRMWTPRGWEPHSSCSLLYPQCLELFVNSHMLSTWWKFAEYIMDTQASEKVVDTIIKSRNVWRRLGRGKWQIWLRDSIEFDV